MYLFPAIDIRDGKCVRLLQGDFAKETIYNENPIEQAKAFVAEGAEFIHIVDLDAAKTGVSYNRKIIAEISSAVPAFLQVGGGVRSESDAKEFADIGVGRVVVGTTAVQNPELLPQMADHIGVAVGLDIRDGKLAVKGWTEVTELDLMETARNLLDSGIEAFVVTDISRDGMLTGVETKLMSELLELLSNLNTNLNTNLEVDLIASGGVSTLDDLKVLASLEKNGKKIAGAIVGKAIYEDAFSVESALEILN